MTFAATRKRSGNASRLVLTATAALALQAMDARAQTSTEGQMFSFGGFGTLGFAHSSEKKADFIANDLQKRGAGYSDDWSPAVDSRIGLQMNADFRSDLSAVVQVVSEQRYDGSYRPAFEWANLRYSLTPDFRVRVGRIVLPSFMTSDARKVGYAQPWVRPPVELYSLMPVTSSDGIDLTYTLRSGEFNHSLRGAYGGTDARIPTGGKAKARDGWLLADTVEYGAFTFHAAYTQLNLTLESYQPLFNAYRNVAAGASLAAAGIPALAAQYNATAAQARAVIDRYEPDGRRLQFLGVGAGYDPGSWFVMGEWGLSNNDSIYGKRTAWYISSGLRFGKFTPYVTFAQAKVKSARSDAAVATNTVDPAGLNASIVGVNAALNQELAASPVQDTASLGLRWDFARSAAFKVQYDHSDVKGNSPGTLGNLQPGFKPGGRFDVWTATVDFVF